MIRDFKKDELQATGSGRDTELTLGGGTLLVLGCGLLVLCTICFGIGYSVGHRTAPGGSALSSPSSNSKGLSVPTGSPLKPGAAGQPPAKQQTTATAGASTGASGSVRPPLAAETVSVGGNPNAYLTHVKPALDSQVHPALIAQTSGAQPTPVLRVQPATTQVQGWMVQIAAVSHTEDATVLIDALRKRGYAVIARREVADTLIHVQTGPFANRNDANAMRQKLLNDGYNAIVE